ncbi:MAG: hypothetical protein L0387_13320 [Acidobacteria bacterium]|nr:hypothetical protein [Acidobacteriota bacterium]MCI0719866.1 hypothetical protein [Acidobacteriota bacterium]
MRQLFESRRNEVLSLLREIPGFRCSKPAGAFYLFPNIEGVCENLGAIRGFPELPPELRGGTSPSTLFQMFALYVHRVAVLDRRSFGQIGSDGQHCIRLSTASNLETLREGVRRLGRAAKDTPGFQGFIA